MPLARFTFIVRGKPEGKGRPKFNTKTGRAYTPAQTTTAEREIRQAWRENGEPAFGRGVPLKLHVHMKVVRPASHFKKNGEFSAEGLRHPYPENKKPDVDNALKLVMDALNSRAYHDDVQIVDARVTRDWGEIAEMRVTCSEI